MDYTTHIVESRLDWLTVTATRPDHREKLFQFGHDLCISLPPEKGPVKAWLWKGYGGSHRQSITYGRREDSDILQLSGPLADQMFDTAYAYCDNVTRLDLCVTVKHSSNIPEVLAAHRAEALAGREHHPGKPTVTGHEENGLLQSVNIGRRVSDVYARFYDKFAESNDPAYADCLRYEIELKGGPAERFAARLAACADRPSAIRDTVREWAQRRGIGVLFDGREFALPVNAVRPRTDRQSRLDWLARSVGPCVRELLATGPVEEVLAALGLPISITERCRLRAAVELGHHYDWLQDWRDDGKDGASGDKA